MVNVIITKQSDSLQKVERKSIVALKYLLRKKGNLNTDGSNFENTFCTFSSNFLGSTYIVHIV